MTPAQIRIELVKMQDLDYLKFSQKLFCTKQKSLGIRIPILRNFAKKILKEDGIKYLSFNDLVYMEEVSLQGYMLSFLKIPFDEWLEQVKLFVPKIENWATCDTVCLQLKVKFENKQKLWDFLGSYSNSKKEFEVRFVTVMIISNFLSSQEVEKSLKFLDKLDTSTYYASIGIAWAVSLALVKNIEITKKYLQTCNLDDKTYNKSLQKACKSFRIFNSDKKILRELKRV